MKKNYINRSVSIAWATFFVLCNQNCTSSFTTISEIDGASSLASQAPPTNQLPPNENLDPEPSTVPLVVSMMKSEVGMNLEPYIPGKGSTIKNPYFSLRTWPVMNVDQSSNHSYLFRDISTDVLITAAPESSRRYPVPLSNYNAKAYETRFINYTQGSVRSTESSGTWDDLYRSEDANHTHLQSAYYDHAQYRGTLSGNAGFFQLFTLQDTRVNYSISPNSGFSSLPMSFSSQSYANRGHAITSNGSNDRVTESSYFFKGSLRGTPAYLSYVDTHATELADNYIGLFSHSFQSLGRSSSEIAFIQKVMLIGSYFDRDLKDLLKVTGHYSSGLMSLWRYSLPYSNDQGEELPIENELFHRPAYASQGHNVPYEFADKNFEYHGYNDGLHVYRMAFQASLMSTPAPITVISTNIIKVYDNDGLIENLVADTSGIFSPSVESTITNAKTITTVIARDNRRIEMYVDLKKSIDLLGRPLAFKLKPIYFNQESNIKVEKLSKSDSLNFEKSGHFYKVTFSHNPNLPRTRMSVGIFAHNGLYWGQPAFLNVIFPGDTFDHSKVGAYYYPDTDSISTARNRNKRPIFRFPSGNIIRAEKNKSIAIAVECSDPEGFPTKIYKWLGEKGRYNNASKALIFQANELDEDKVENIRLICSDGTAGYSSTLVKIQVGSVVDDETADAIFCKNRTGSTCNLPDNRTYRIFYGRLENPYLRYEAKSITGRNSFRCNEEDFPVDPIPGLKKECFYKRLD